MYLMFALSMAMPCPALELRPSEAEIQRLGFDPARIRAMRDRMAAAVSSGSLHGVVTLFERHGKVVSLDAFGTLRVGTPEPMRSDAIFQVMSMSKPVTAVAVAILAERGLLRFNDSAALYLPAFAEMKLADGKRSETPIRIHHLLSHTSGIAGDMPIEDEDRARMTLGAFVDLVSKQPLRSEPGAETRYSGPGTSVAGRIVEVVSKKAFDRFCADEIFTRLEMLDSHFFLPRGLAGRLAGLGVWEQGKLAAGKDDPMRPGSRFANPAGGLYSTARDMARFHRAMLEKGRLLSPGMVRLMTSPGPRLPGGSEESGFGLGWSVSRGPGPSRSLLPPGAFGHSGAFGTYGWADPTNDIVGVFMAQRIGGEVREIEIFRSMVYAALLPSN